MNNTYFVVRDTNHPEDDLSRNWSSFAGGSCNGEEGGKTAEEARENFARHLGIEISEVSYVFRYHPAYGEYVAVHYEGLGAWMLDAESLESALEEAASVEDGLAFTWEAGDGKFFAEDVVSFHKVREGKYVFEIKI